MKTLKHSPQCGITAKKMAELCGYTCGCLRFIKTLCSTIGGERAILGNTTPKALFLLRETILMLRVVFLPMTQKLSHAAYYYTRTNYSGDGQRKAFAAFFIGKSL